MEGLRQGADDYVVKPFEAFDRLVTSSKNRNVKVRDLAVDLLEPCPVVSVLVRSCR